MRSYTAYAIVETTPRTGRKELALFDARLPLFWRRKVAVDMNRERCGGLGEIVQVSIVKRKRKSAARKQARAA